MVGLAGRTDQRKPGGDSAGMGLEAVTGRGFAEYKASVPQRTFRTASPFLPAPAHHRW